MRLHSYLIASVSILSMLAAPNPVLSADLVNNAVITGDWTGTSDPDTMTNQAAGVVTDDIIANDNSADNAGGGGNTVNNYGSVGDEIDGSFNNGVNSSGGENTIHNSGDVGQKILGSSSYGKNAKGGKNTITNAATGVVGDFIAGSANEGEGAGGGENTIYNHGKINLTGIFGSLNGGKNSSGGSNHIENTKEAGTFIDGSLNAGVNSSGGNNTIKNSGSVRYIYGSYNAALGTTGGGNTIVNSGAVEADIFGACNVGDNSSGSANTIINQSGGSVRVIYGQKNEGDNTSGGGNTIYNYGTVTNTICGTYKSGANTSGGGNTIYNHGTVQNDIYGDYSTASTTESGNNAIYNYGIVADDIYGSNNRSAGVQGGSNTIVNYQTVGDGSTTDSNIYGSRNMRENSGGGENTILNSGSVLDDIYGSKNEAKNTKGGDNNITSSGSVGGSIYGSLNEGEGASGGGNTITNSGTVDGSIYGGYNIGVHSTSTGNTITNSGTVNGDIWGSYNSNFGAEGGDDHITNSGIVRGSIYAEDGDDTVIMESGPETVGGVIDGGSGIDTFGVRAGTWLSTRVINFEKLDINATGDLTLLKPWDAGNATVRVSGGKLTVNDTLNGGELNINSGSAVINGQAIISGGVGNNGSLTVNPGGMLTAKSLNSRGKAFIKGSAAISGRITNSGYLNVGGRLSAENLTNSGTATIGGTASISGNTSNTGSLNVNGLFRSARLINSGRLSGSGLIRAEVYNTGVISPGNSIDTLNIAGSLKFTESSSLFAELDSQGPSDQVAVTGAATIDGGTITTNISRALYGNNFSWKLITATEGVNGVFEQVEDRSGSVVLSLDQQNNGNTLSLVLKRKPYADFAKGGAADTGRGMDALVSLASGDMGNLLLAMDFDMDAAQIGQVLNNLNPEMYLAFSAASLKAGGLFDSSLGLRMRELSRERAFAADEQGEQAWSLWGRALGLWADQEQMDNHLGFGQSTGGGVLGADYAFNKWLMLGLASGVTQSRLSWARGNYAGDIEALHTGFYAQTGFGGAYARFTATYARLKNSASRQVNLAGENAEAKSEFDGDVFASGLALGYQLRLGEWLLEPLAALDYQALKEEGFSETGAGFLNIDVAERNTDSLMTSLGLSASRMFCMQGWEILPRLGLSWRHQLRDDQPSLDAAFTGYQTAPFTVYGADFPGDLLFAEAGVSLTLKPGFDFFADYSMAWADDYLAQSLTAGLMISF